MSFSTRIAVGAALSSVAPASAWYLPGVAPHDFFRGEQVELKVNKLTSTRTQVPYEYYSLPFCTPKEGVVTSAENLGEFLSGDRIDNSPYELFMRDDSTCNVLCQQHYGKRDVEAFKTAIDEGYHHNWIIDNLPAAAIVQEDGFIETSYSKGFPVGYKVAKGVDAATDATPLYSSEYAGGVMAGMDATAEYYLFNHVELIVKYHELGEDANRVVGFYVEPRSVKHLFANGEHWYPDAADDYMPYLTTCEKYAADPIDAAAEDNAEWAQMFEGDAASTDLATKKEKKAYGVNGLVEPQKVEPGSVLFTYDVTWRPSEIHWASRWDIYLSMDNAVPDKVHWFSIVNSVLIVAFLSSMIGMILIRNVHRDIASYNRVMTDEEKQEEREESGWKLVHTDVFRPPATLPMLFCVFVGTGVQVFWMSLFTVLFAAVGFLSPANRGSLMIAMLLIYVVMGGVAGLKSANLYKTFRGKAWQKCTLLTAFLYPGLSFLIFFGFNLMLWSYGSSGAVPILSMVAIVSLWFGISVPLVFLGAYIGFRKNVESYPTHPRVTALPRPIPEQPWFLGTAFTIVIGGILPFGACFVELFFILSSMWMDQYYYVFGFLLLVFFILCVTCAEITMVLVYFQLCAEDYNWWWRSFLTSGSTALYVFLYSAFYFSKLEANLAITYFLYFGYMFIICFGLFLMTGLVGYTASLWFTKKIYGSIKVD